MLRSRLSGLLLALVLAFAFLPVGGGLAADGASSSLTLATEAGGEGGAVEEPPGPEPNPTSSFAPADYEAPWTWWMGVLLTAVAVLAIGGTALGYYLLVQRPRQKTEA